MNKLNRWVEIALFCIVLVIGFYVVIVLIASPIIKNIANGDQNLEFVLGSISGVLYVIPFIAWMGRIMWRF